MLVSFDSFVFILFGFVILFAFCGLVNYLCLLLELLELGCMRGIVYDYSYVGLGIGLYFVLDAPCLFDFSVLIGLMFVVCLLWI